MTSWSRRTIRNTARILSTLLSRLLDGIGLRLKAVKTQVLLHSQWAVSLRSAKFCH